MQNEALVQLALQELSCNQRTLADLFGVSPTQISKWKKGEHMSHDMEVKFREMLGIGDELPEFIIWAGSRESAAKWEKLIHFLAEQAQFVAETGYNTYPLTNEDELLCWRTAHTLVELGLESPQSFPAELDVDYEPEDDSDAEKLDELLSQNRYVRLIERIYKSLNDVYGFYAAYVSDLLDDDALNLHDTDAVNIEPCLMSLAAAKIDFDDLDVPGGAEFRRRVLGEYQEWLAIVKEHAFRAGIPLRAELLAMVHDSHDELGHEAEAESLGFNADRIHPDIYMNELLCGMRVIHQVLPAIMKKLGIDEDFKLDASALRIP